jgi:hypothetical protein
VSSLLRVIFDPDTTAPSVPTLNQPTVVGQDRLDLSWSVSTDTGGAGLAGYDILIDGVAVVQVGIQTSYSATGLATGSTHSFRVRARDLAIPPNVSAYSTQVSGTTASAPAVYNPNYPRFGSYSIAGTQLASDAALAACHVNVVVHYPGWQQSKGVSWATKCTLVKSLSAIGTKIVPYVLYTEITDSQANAGQANWEVWQQALNNGLWVYQNGATETTRIPAHVAGSSKLNYTTAGKLVAGENFAQWKLRWDYRLNVSGGSFSNGSTSLTVTTNAAGFDGVFFDNVFAQERPAAGTGATGDYDRNGTQDTLSGATSIALVQSSHLANSVFYRTLFPQAYVLANSADWPIYYPTGVTGTPLDQAFDGGVLEHLQEWADGTRGNTMAAILTAIGVQMNGYRAPKLGIASVLISSATNYAALRYWHAICALTDSYYYPHVSANYLAQELGTINYDERMFSLGTASEATQYTPRYQSGANGRGIYRRDFANGIVLVFAQDGTATNYTAQSLGGTFHRLFGSLDGTTNNGTSMTTTPVMAPGTALVLARTSQDTIAPSVPGSLAATAVSSSVINLSWNASTDTGGSLLQGYRLERSLNGTSGWSEITQPAGTTYSDTGRSASTQYFYRVRAVDNIGLFSAYSNIANATTQAAAGGGAINHGDLVSVSGTSLGTMPDYNTGAYSWKGSQFLPWQWSDLVGFPASGSSSATFAAALNGLLPSAGAFSFNANYAAEGITVNNGGPSRGGKYMRMTGAFTADDGYIFRTTPSGAPVPSGLDMYVTWWSRWSGNGKNFRFWQEGGGSPNTYFTLSGGVCIEGQAIQFFDNMPSMSVFRRWEVWMRGASSGIWCDGVRLTRDGGNQNFNVQVGGNQRNLDISWPNSVDGGNFVDIADVYANFTTMRVELSDGTRWAPQIVTAWSPTDVAYRANLANLISGPGTERIMGPTNNILATRSVTIGT